MDNDLFINDPECKDILAGNPIYSGIIEAFQSNDFFAEMLRAFDKEIKENLESGELLWDPNEATIADTCLETRSGSPISSKISGRTIFPRIDLGSAGVNYGVKNGGKGIHTDNRRRLFSGLF